MKDEGTNSLFGGAANWIAKKLVGEEKAQHGLYDHFQRPLTNMDERAGKVLSKHLAAPKLFTQVDVLPTSRKIGGNHALIEHTRHSATAPIGKAVKFVTPLAAAVGVSNLLARDGEDKMAQQNDPTEDKDELLKEASAAFVVAHRRLEAEKLAFSMVERGKIPPFMDYESFQEKVASILDKDLAVVEEALELDADLADMGKVASEKTPVAGADSAVAAFYHRLAD